jgi:hypothetical protein
VELNFGSLQLSADYARKKKRKTMKPRVVVASLTAGVALGVGVLYADAHARVPSGPMKCVYIIRAVRELPGYHYAKAPTVCKMDIQFSRNVSSWILAHTKPGHKYLASVVVGDRTCEFPGVKTRCFYIREVLYWYGKRV